MVPAQISPSRAAAVAHFRSLSLIGLIALGLGVSGCEKVKPYVLTAKEILDRDTAPALADRAEPIEEIPPPPEPVAMEPVINKEARVSILGYHYFVEGTSRNDMGLNEGHFREQMQAIKDSEIPVISMRQFLEWKQGIADIPAEAIMITFDDGWKSTHTLALPVLIEYGYPFTVFLYKNYVGIGGRSLSFDEVRDIAANGGTICSHSVSHQNMASRAGRSVAAHDEWLRVELEESHEFLVENFGDTGAVEKAFAFPFGVYSDRAQELAREYGYEACFTVNGKKTTWETDDMEIGRYIVMGQTLANFEPALSFGGGGMSATSRKLISPTRGEDGEKQEALVTLRPPLGSTIGNRLPLIEADLSKLGQVDPDSISLRMSGFGRVPHQFDPATQSVRYQVPQRLRDSEVTVQLSFLHAGNPELERIAWDFKLDRIADYLDSTTTQPGTNETIEPRIFDTEEDESVVSSQ
ncbi:MAG: polysaccharide deacetylase family protein [Verrucomicrobiota bacterium]